MPRPDGGSRALEPRAGMWSSGGKVSERDSGAAGDVPTISAFPEQREEWGGREGLGSDGAVW